MILLANRSPKAVVDMIEQIGLSLLAHGEDVAELVLNHSLIDLVPTSEHAALLRSSLCNPL